MGAMFVDVTRGTVGTSVDADPDVDVKVRFTESRCQGFDSFVHTATGVWPKHANERQPYTFGEARGPDCPEEVSHRLRRVLGTRVSERQPVAFNHAWAHSKRGFAFFSKYKIHERMKEGVGPEIEAWREVEAYPHDLSAAFNLMVEL